MQLAFHGKILTSSSGSPARNGFARGRWPQLAAPPCAQMICSCGSSRQRALVHGLPIPQHRDAVADGAQFFQPVRDVDDAHLALAQRSHDAEHLFGFRAGERRSGLIENQQAGAMLNRAADLHHLLARGAELFHSPFRAARGN